MKRCLLACFVAVAAVAAEPSILDEHPTPQQVMADLYKYLIEGNHADLKENQKRAAHFHRVAEKATTSERKKELSRYFSAGFAELAKSNQKIVQCLAGNDLGDLESLLDRYDELEAKIRKHDGPLVKREWMTMSEVRRLMATDAPYWTESPRILPFARKHWDPSQHPSRASRSRNPKN
ncbi:MAG TPA: hypothetical protein DCR55_16385 [Lentisphaeria bacterium]|jgi:hypothetical protein|nr:hypothetical protein [Lentisphaeria bacterium]